MDNAVFNVNGRGEEMLLNTLELAFLQREYRTCNGWKITKKGFILSWCLPSNSAFTPFPGNVEFTPKEVLPLILKWLQSDTLEEIEMNGWDANIDQDGHNSLGWRVYSEDWGHVDDYWEAICAIKPAYLWYGK
jgi:hypothetical protein